MITVELISFVKSELFKGLAREDIIRLLTNQSKAGWQRADIEEVFSVIDNEQKLQQTSPRVNSQANMAPLSPNDSASNQKVNAALTSTEKSMLGILAILFGIFFLGGGVFAFWYLSQNKSSTSIIYLAYQNFLELKSYSFFGDLSVNARLSGFGDKLDFSQNTKKPASQTTWLQTTTISSSSSAQQISFLMAYDGSTNAHDPVNPKFNLNSNIKIAAADYLNTTLNISLRAINDTIYARVSGPLSGYSEGINQFINHWISINLNNLVETIEQYNPKEAALLKTRLERYFSDRKSDLSPERIRRLIDVAKQIDLIQIKSKLPDENVFGAASYHYTLKINWQELGKFYMELLHLLEKEPALDMYAREQINNLYEALKTSREHEQIRNNLMRFADFLDKNMTIELWVDKKSILPKQTLYRLKISPGDLTEIFGSEYSGYDKLENLTINLHTTFNDFNTPTTVEAPPDSVPLFNFIEKLSVYDVTDP